MSSLAAWGRVRDYRVYQLQQLPNVQIYLDGDMGVDDVLGFDADKIIIATGSRWRRDVVGSKRFTPIDGLESLPTFTPQDILINEAVQRSGTCSVALTVRRR